MRKLIIENLHKLIEAGGYRIAPQNYGAEFRQTGSGKSINGVSNKDVISDAKLNQVMAQLAMAKDIAQKYRKAYENGEEGLFVNWMGKKILMRIPNELRTAMGPDDKPVDYSHYFDVPTIGDGGFQYSVFKNGNILGGNIKSRPDMDRMPNMGSATDAGYNKVYDDRIKYLYVKAGVLGKYQEEAGNFSSMLGTPAMDAAVKVRNIFHDEILDFLTKDKGAAQYTSDKKGADIANKMEFEKKLDKVRKDAEMAIGKPIYGSTTWMDFKDKLKIMYDNPQEQKAMDINQMTQEFLKLYKAQNPEKTLGKPEVSLDQSELDAAEKQRELIKARIAAARARK